MHCIIGASGSGKSAVMPYLSKLMPELRLYDFDEIGVPDDADAAWRQRTTVQWLAKLNRDHAKQPCCLLGQMVPAEIYSVKLFDCLAGVTIVLLDCADDVRIKRLRQRGSNAIDQHGLNWSSWLRQQCVDPTWQQHVIPQNVIDGVDWSRWLKLQSWPAQIQIRHVDTTFLTLEQVAYAVKNCIAPTAIHVEGLAKPVVFEQASADDIEAVVSLLVDDPLGAERESMLTDLSTTYNAAFDEISASGDAQIVVARHQGRVIACAQINFLRNLTYEGGMRAQIEGVRVSKSLQGRGIGRHLFDYLVALAKQRHCHMVQLTTNMQRPDAIEFYKHLGFVDSHIGFKLHL